MKLTTRLETYGKYHSDTDDYDVLYFTIPSQWLVEHLKNDSYRDWPQFANDDEIVFDFVSNYDWDAALLVLDDAKVELPEITEVCPHCDFENSYNVFWDVEKYGYEIECQNCGELIMLCDECMHEDDNKGMKCDWCEAGCWRKCKEV